MIDNPVYILDCRRTPIASTSKGLKSKKVYELAAVVMDALVDDNATITSNISEVILGNAVSAGTGQNLARHAVSLSSLPISTPAFVVNNVCGSGLQALILGIQKIFTNEAEVVLSGAAESATHSPLLFEKQGRIETDSLQQDGLFCSLANKSMGDICDALSKAKAISRAKQDVYALESHKKACAARKRGDFQDEIVGVKVSKTETFLEDQRPREKTSIERLKSLPPAFSETGSVTAGNASSAADGACGFVLCSSKFIKKQKVSPLAKICGYASIATDPAHVFDQGIVAVKKCLEKCSMTMDDIDLFEITEAFCAQAIFTQEALGIPKEKMNIFGGDVALGHPLGIAGARSLVTLVYALKNKKKKRGLVYTPFGSGGAIALAVEMVS